MQNLAMQALSPHVASALADGILVLHTGIVGFVVVGQVLFLMGGWRNWTWVRNLALRLAHLALMLFIALQSWLGLACPLTVWEQALREHAGQSAYRETFIEHWLARLIFYEAPWWQFVALYSGFALLVALTWWWVPPRKQKHREDTASSRP